MRPIFDALRTIRLAGADLPKPQVGDPDPAYPGQAVRAGRDGAPLVQLDRIVPLAEMLKLPGFLKLEPDDMYSVVIAPINLQWLSRRAQVAKSAAGVALLTRVDPDWQRAQVVLEVSTSAELTRLIDRLLARTR